MNYFSVIHIKDLEDEITAMQGERRSFIAERNDFQSKWSRFQEGAEQEIKEMKEANQKYVTANEKLREACQRKNYQINQLQEHLGSQFAMFNQQSAQKGKLSIKTMPTNCIFEQIFFGSKVKYFIELQMSKSLNFKWRLAS